MIILLRLGDTAPTIQRATFLAHAMRASSRRCGCQDMGPCTRAASHPSTRWLHPHAANGFCRQARGKCTARDMHGQRSKHHMCNVQRVNLDVVGVRLLVVRGCWLCCLLAAVSWLLAMYCQGIDPSNEWHNHLHVHTMLLALASAMRARA